MDRLVQLVISFQLAPDLERRLALGDVIAEEVVPRISPFIQRKVPFNSFEDVVQETLRGIARGLASFNAETDSQFWAWCFRIARSQIALRCRNAAKEIVDFVDPNTLESVAELKTPDAEGPSVEQIFKLLDQVDPEACQFAYAFYVLEISWVELSLQAGRSESAIRMQVRRAFDFIAPQLTAIYEH